jgi:hypothetical protein
MTGKISLEELTVDMAEVLPNVDSETAGQYGDGLGSENEEHQVEFLIQNLRTK